MATKTSPSRRSSSRSKPTRKTSAGGAGRRPRRRRRRRGRPPRTPTRQILSPHARDAAGIGLVVFALLSVLSVWFDAAGPVGHSISRVLYVAFGLGAYVFPVAGVYWGVVLLRDVEPRGPGPDVHRLLRADARCTRPRCRSPAGTRVRSPRTPTRGIARGLADAGGVVGALAAYPLSRVLSVYGAFVVDAGLAFLGLLIFTGTLVRAAEGTGVDVRPDAPHGGTAAEPTAPMVTVPQPEKVKKEPSRRKLRCWRRWACRRIVVVLPEAAEVPGFTEAPAEEPMPPAKAAKPRTVTHGLRSVSAPARSICCARRRLRRTTASTRRRSWRRSPTR